MLQSSKAPDKSGNYNGGHIYEAVGNNDRCSLQKLSQHILKDAQKNEQNYGRYINPEIPCHRGQYAAQRREHGIHEQISDPVNPSNRDVSNPADKP